MLFKENVLVEVLYQLVIDWSSRLQKHQTLEILTIVGFLRIFLKYPIFFFRFLKFISSLCKNCCMHFILSEQDSPN